MQGAEYLSEAALLGIWEDLDAWARGAIAAGGEGLSGFLKRRAPCGTGGRVCFHLAENRRNEDSPLPFWRPMRRAWCPAPASSTSRSAGPCGVGRRENKKALVGCSRRCSWRRNRAPW